MLVALEASRQMIGGGRPRGCLLEKGMHRERKYGIYAFFRVNPLSLAFVLFFACKGQGTKVNF